jgi:pathogenesis-related protein 1
MDLITWLFVFRDKSFSEIDSVYNIKLLFAGRFLKKPKALIMKNSLIMVVVILFSISAIAQSVPAKTGSNVTQGDAQQALEFHNKARKDVAAKPLKWCAEVAAYAQAWADELASRKCAFEHRSGEKKDRGYGENIFMGSGADYTALDASESWYSEIKEYVHGPLNSSNWSKTGHYTQMVWSSTTEVGIGTATCKSGSIIIVANYSPPGNYMGQKAY